LNFPVRLAALVLMMAMPAIARAELFLLRAELQPTEVEPLASGDAFTYQTYTHPFEGGLAVGVRDVFRTDTVAVLINNRFVTTITLTNGRGQVILSSSLGDQVPLILDGDILDIVDPDDGSVLLEGIFELLCGS
jgi:hypothetical protein